MITLSTPGVAELGDVVRSLREWQHDEASAQLHPGDVGWNWSFGAEAMADALRLWKRDEEILAVGFMDSDTVIRLAVARGVRDDTELIAEMVRDLSVPERGVLPSGEVSVEARFAGLLRQRLREKAWIDGEAWTPLQRDLRDPVEETGVRIEVVGVDSVRERVMLQRASFERSTFSEERWYAMADGLPYADAQCLVAYDEQDDAVAVVTVWSAGPGRPGLLEPMGVHRDYRGRGYGRAITLGAAAALRRMGSSSATVCTQSANVGAVATYRSAGFQQRLDVPDLRRAPTS